MGFVFMKNHWLWWWGGVGAVVWRKLGERERGPGLGWWQWRPWLPQAWVSSSSLDPGDGRSVLSWRSLHYAAWKLTLELTSPCRRSFVLLSKGWVVPRAASG